METLVNFTIRLAPKNRQRLAYLLSFFLSTIVHQEQKQEIEIIQGMLNKLKLEELIYSYTEIVAFMSLSTIALENNYLTEDFKQEILFLRNLLEVSSQNEKGITFLEYLTHNNKSLTGKLIGLKDRFID
ncbi:MAG: hypothetical protein RML72_04765 [Bacteroidia bacterium]|nr:hypothetical protein [Bacteroidia bacterium]MDW8158175.1 hypothetical protein [Bacteroidia bacterium]